MVVLFCTNQSMAQCPEDPGDLGICDTLYVEIFDCDHQYQASAGYDSVRVAIYVTHDSNTFWWSGGNRWVQDSIVAFMVPLTFWHPPEGCVDSVILPNGWDDWDWNNTSFVPEYLPRSIFRHLVDAHTGDTTFNRMLKANIRWSTRILDVEHLSCDGDSGHAWLCLMDGPRKKWYEGSKVLLATLTFLVYMDSSCDSTAICLDSMYGFPPSPWGSLSFMRYGATAAYTPRHFLPVCETIYVLRGDVNGDGKKNISDLVYLINYLFVSGSPAPAPLWAGDVNCDKIVNISDVVFLINYLFIPGSPPPPPGCP
jgi:hypothetical protein